MRKISLMLIVALLLTSLVGLSGCSTNTFAQEGSIIITPKEALELSKQENVVLVDIQNEAEYQMYHVPGAVNIQLSEITTNEPYPNMLASKEKIEKTMSENGISNDTMVIAYDNNNNMVASRLWWTLFVYGHENVKVVSGGIGAFGRDGVEFTQEVPEVEEAEFTAGELRTEYIVTKEEVEGYLNEPEDDIIILDTRTPSEHNEGTIPTSVLYNYENNNYSTGAFKSPKDIQNEYLDQGLEPEDTYILYCKTSVRATQTFVALWNAGYRNLKIYDGAWLEWSDSQEVPEEQPSDNSAPVAPGTQDGS